MTARLIAALLGLAPAESARACMCVDVSPAAALAEHDAVFEGRVVSLERADGVLRATLEVVQHWKGLETERAIVRTAESSAACGISFEPDTSWLVYADREGDELLTGICSRTRRIEDAEDDMAVLGAGVVPIEIGPEDEVEAREDEPPARGGCASCSAAPSALPNAIAWPIAILIAIRTCRSSSCRAGASRPRRAAAGTRSGP